MIISSISSITNYQVPKKSDNFRWLSWLLQITHRICKYTKSFNWYNTFVIFGEWQRFIQTDITNIAIYEWGGHDKLLSNH